MPPEVTITVRRRARTRQPKVSQPEPDYLQLYERAEKLQANGKHEAALEQLEDVLQLKPNFVSALGLRGLSLYASHRYDEARDEFENLSQCLPDNAEVYCNLGAAQLALNQPKAAATSLRRSLALNPNHAATHCNLGLALQGLDRQKEALACFKQAITLKPDYAYALYQHARLSAVWDNTEIALRDYERAITLDPDSALFYFSKSLLLISLGHFHEGWALYDWRLRAMSEGYPRLHRQPLWEAHTPMEALAGKTLFVRCEQGLGDQIQSVRYVLLLAEAGVHVLLEVRLPLLDLMRTLADATRRVHIVLTNDPLPHFDYYCWVMSLPHLTRHEPNVPPLKTPYLFSSADKQSDWIERLGPRSRPRIGLVWSGSTTNPGDKYRSMKLSQLRPLLELPCEFHALHNEIRPEDEALLDYFPNLRVHCTVLKDFSDAAALIEQMDLVIAVETAAAHLAAAMHKPVWLLLSRELALHFRWTRWQLHTIWYDSVRLWWQPAPTVKNTGGGDTDEDHDDGGIQGSWEPLVTDVVAELRRLYPAPSAWVRICAWLQRCLSRRTAS